MFVSLSHLPAHAANLLTPSTYHPSSTNEQPGQDLRDLAGVQVRISEENQCAAQNVQVQTGTGISAIQVTWTNITEVVSLCCSGAWQYIPFNTTRAVPPDGYGTFIRLTVYSSFGNPNKASVNGFRLLSRG